MNSIEMELMGKKRYDERIEREKENQEWLGELIRGFQNEFGAKSELYEKLEKSGAG
jgi:hypothetical protein